MAPARVDRHPGERPPLANWVALGGRETLSLRAFSCHISCTLRARPWYSAQTSQPPSKQAHSPRSGVDMIKIRSSTQAATYIGSVKRAKKRATARTMHPRGLPAVFRQNWHVANLNTNRRSRSLSGPCCKPALQYEGVQPFTTPSTYDNSLGCPSPVDVMIGHLLAAVSVGLGRCAR